MYNRLHMVSLFVLILLAIGAGWFIANNIDAKEKDTDDLAERTYSGEITRIKDDKIKIEMDNGKKRTFTLTDHSFIQYGTDIGDHKDKLEEGLKVNILADGKKIELIHLQSS